MELSTIKKIARLIKPKEREQKMTKTTSIKKAGNVKKKEEYKRLLRNYERQVITPTDHGEALQALSTAVAYAVLKKCIQVSCNNTLIKKRRELATGIANIKNLKYAAENAYVIRYDSNGEKKRIIDRSLSEAMKNPCKETLGDGIDIVNTAAIAIMSETEKIDPSERTLGYLERPYKIRKLKRRVWIKKEDSIGGWDTIETTPIQQVYRAVRRYITDSGAIRAASHVYTYLEDISRDGATGALETIYRRLGKYADLGGYTTDIYSDCIPGYNSNGRSDIYTADETTAGEVDALIENLNLSKQQVQIVQLELRGYGLKAIATYLGVDYRNVYNQLRRIRAKYSSKYPQ